MDNAQVPSQSLTETDITSVHIAVVVDLYGICQGRTNDYVKVLMEVVPYQAWAPEKFHAVLRDILVELSAQYTELPPQIALAEQVGLAFRWRRREVEAIEVSYGDVGVVLRYN